MKGPLRILHSSAAHPGVETLKKQCFKAGTPWHVPCKSVFETEQRAEIRKGNNMLGWVVIFLIIALVAGMLGFSGIAGAAVGIAKVIFVIFLILFLVSLIFHITAKK
jgi:uncharacterized membrane protein YtjA (UPF0391 family)